MFGYVQTVRGELRVREYEYYRASYCGLCRSMGKCTGQCSRLLLNYDLAYLATVRMALLGVTPTFRRRRCIAHPFRRRMMMEPNEQLRYCAEATVILAYEKCRDDLSDERGWGRAKARLRSSRLRPVIRLRLRLPPTSRTDIPGSAEPERMRTRARLPSRTSPRRNLKICPTTKNCRSDRAH